MAAATHASVPLGNATQKRDEHTLDKKKRKAEKSEAARVLNRQRECVGVVKAKHKTKNRKARQIRTTRQQQRASLPHGKAVKNRK